MKAAVLYKPNTPMKIEELELADPAAGEVLVKVMASGVCHSDWHILKGEWSRDMPMVLGHEGAGIVEAVGPNVSTVKRGDHVILTFCRNCGRCETCQMGSPMLCDRPLMPSSKPRIIGTGTAVDQMNGLGTFGNYTVVPEIDAVPIDEDIPLPQAALLGCGVITGVGAAINTARVRPGTAVAVFGCGGVGLNCIQGSFIAGAATIIAVDLVDGKLDLAREFGATHTVNASREDPVERIKELTGGAGADYAFEAIGLVEAPFVQSILCTRKRGLTVWVGHAPDNTPVTIDAKALAREKMVMGSIYGSARPQVEIPRLISLYKAGRLKLDELVSRQFPLDEINDAFDLLGSGDVLARGVITFD